MHHRIVMLIVSTRIVMLVWRRRVWHWHWHGYWHRMMRIRIVMMRIVWLDDRMRLRFHFIVRCGLEIIIWIMPWIVSMSMTMIALLRSMAMGMCGGSGRIIVQSSIVSIFSRFRMELLLRMVCMMRLMLLLLLVMVMPVMFMMSVRMMRVRL